MIARRPRRKQWCAFRKSQSKASSQAMSSSGRRGSADSGSADLEIASATAAPCRLPSAKRRSERSCRINTAAGKARRLSSHTGASIASNRGRSEVSSASSCSNSSRLERHAGDKKPSGHVFEEPRLKCFRSKDNASRTSLQAAASSSPGFRSECAPGTSPCQSPSPRAALCFCRRDSSARAAKLSFFRAMYLDSSTLERTPWTSPSSSSTPPSLQFRGGGSGTEDKSYATSTGAVGEY
mmetsp:Transcript_72820/g.170849  ORF Transcript_72820/g.170849 Transcript_72820/m.170849 type:complete len:238 (-) Transcript_72820:205-918(-)